VPQLMFYRYTDEVEAAAIRQSQRIEPGAGRVTKWYTPDRYDTGLDARRFLALRYTPVYRVGPIPEDELPDLDHAPLRVVQPAYGQPGGGLEVATTKPMYLFDITPLPAGI
jgi:hypothetical protein